MKSNRILCLLLSFVIILSTCGGLGLFSASATEEPLDYVRDGLVSWFCGNQNTHDGHNKKATVWQDLISGYDLPVKINQNNYFTKEGFRVNGLQHYLPKKILDLVNSSYFTIEIEFGDFIASGTNYNVFMNSDNDHFSLFRRVSKDVIEWKFGNNHSSTRPTISESMRYIPHHILTFTCEYGDSVIMYVNGVEMARANCDLYMDADSLFIGQNMADRSYDALYKNIRFYSRALTAEEVAQNARTAGYDTELNEPVANIDHISIVQPQTRIVGDVAMVRPVNSAVELKNMVNGEVLPAVAVYEINDKLEVLGENGVPFSTVEEVLAKTKYQLLPCFSIQDKRTADALAKYLNTLYFFDVQLMSADKNVLKYAREHLPSCYGVLDLREEYENVADLSEEQLLDIRRTVKAYGGYIAILPVELCRKEDVQYLYDRQVNVWAWGSDTPDVTEQYYALLSGAIGVVSDVTDSYLDIACNKLAKNTVTRTPANAGHRGLPSQAPECTLESSILAYEMGANVIEMDVYLTTDGHIVAMHDGTTGRTCNQNLVVESSTLAELKRLYVNKGYENHPTYSACRIPTLDEYLKWFKGKDCLFFIELKSSSTNIVPALKKVIDKYDAYSQCTVITFNEDLMAAMHEKYPEMPVGCLNGAGLMWGSTSDADMPIVMNSIGRFNGTHNPAYETCTASDLRACLLRGISVYPWTINSTQALTKYYLSGFNSLTNDYANLFERTAYRISLAEEPQLQTNTAGELNLSVCYYNRTTEIKPVSEIILLDGKATIHKNIITPTDNGTLTYMTSYSFRVLDSVTCVMYTQPMTIRVGKPQDEETTADTSTDTIAETIAISDVDESTDDPLATDTPITETEEGTAEPPEKKGCRSTVDVMILILIAAGAVLTVFRKKKSA